MGKTPERVWFRVCENQEMNMRCHVKVWGRAFQAQGTAAVKASRWESTREWRPVWLGQTSRSEANGDKHTATGGIRAGRASAAS